MNGRKYMTDSEMRELKIRRNRVRRQRQLRRRIVIAIAAFIIVLSSSFGLTSILSKASDHVEVVKVKVYSSVMMPYGSDIYELASEYFDDEYYETTDDYIKEVMFINHLNDTDVQPGYYLILPRYTEEF